MEETVYSNMSKYSQCTQQVYQIQENQSQGRLQQIQQKALNGRGSSNQSIVQSLGLYIYRSLVQNVAVQIPSLGVFSILQNYINNEPVFFIQKEFIKGIDIKSGVFTEQGQIRVLSNQVQNGRLRVKRVNWMELLRIVNEKQKDQLADKDNIKVQLDNLIRTLQQSYIGSQQIYFEIPCVGVLIMKNGKSCVRFYQQLLQAIQNNKKYIKQTSNCFNRSSKSIDYEAIKQQSMSNGLLLNRDNLEQLNRQSSYEPWQNRMQYSQEGFNSIQQQYDGMNYDGMNYDGEIDQDVQNFIKPTSDAQVLANINNRYCSIQEQSKNHKSLQSGLQKIQGWLRKNNYFPLEGFKQLMKYVVHKHNRIDEIVLSIRLSYKQFELGLKSEIKDINSKEIKMIEQYVDINKEGWIDGRSWTKQINDENMQLGLLLVPFQKVVEQNGYHLDQVIDILQFQLPIDQNQIKQSFKKLCSNLTEDKYNKIAKIVLQGQSQMNFKNIKQKIQYYFESIFDKQKEDDRQIMSLIQQNPKFQEISKKEFKENSIDKQKMKELLKQLDIEGDNVKGFVNRLAVNEVINESEFMKTVDNVNSYKNKLVVMAQNLLKYMKKQQFTVLQLLQDVSENCPVNLFCQYLQKNVQPNIDLSTVGTIDIDQNGVIDFYDLSTFLKRYQYLNEKKIFPIKSVDQDEIDKLLIELRRRLDVKRIKINSLFGIIDTNKDGFIDINEFNSGLQQIVDFGQTTKEKLFSYFDNMQIGLIDQQRFIEVLKKSPGIGISSYEDNFDWQFQMIRKLKEYAQSKRINYQDLFRMIDKNFDENISIQNLRVFLQKELMVKRDELQDIYLERLYKLFDVHKHNHINRQEFKKIYEQLNVDSQTDDQFDWKKCAIQQIGIFIVNKYQSIKEGFNMISQNQSQIKYAQFNQFILDNKVLFDFSLTDKLVQQLFAYLDKHRKGFLSIQDWLMSFKNFDKQGLIFQEFIECLTFNFKNTNDAFKYFANRNDNKISKQDLEKGILKLLPQRLNNKDIEKLYRLMSKNESISQKEFINKLHHIFEKENAVKRRKISTSMSTSMNKLDRMKLNISQSISNRNGSSNEFYSSGLYGRSILSQKNQNTFRVSDTISRYQSNYESSKSHSQLVQQPEDYSDIPNILYKLKSIFKDDLDNLVKKFKEYDPDNTGIISNLQFRKALRNWGFCARDIDLLFQIVEQFNGQIKYNQVIHKLSNRKHDSMIQQRPKDILKKLKTDIIYYLISVNDAFKRFNKDQTGFMKYEEFNNLVTYIYRMNNHKEPIFPVIKELFDYIDCRQDGVIDIHEWTQIFRKIEYEQQKPTDDNMLRFENTQKNDNFVYLVSKSRKVLQSILKEEGKGEHKLLCFNKAVNSIVEFMKQNKLDVDSHYVAQMVGFAKDKEKRNMLDYRYMLDVFKARQLQMNCVRV